jgi:serine/threonine-protein kinase SRPK3
MVRNLASHLVSKINPGTGAFIGNGLIPFERSLSDLVPDCITAREEKEKFIDFVRNILCWLPEKRMSAEGLQNHPWLGMKRI